MKEFKYCHEEITEGVEIPVTVHETQKELLSDISLLIRDVKDIGMGEEESIYIIYKDGSKYFAYDEGEEGKFKRYGIKSAVYEHVNGYVVFGDFAITDNGDISIEENDIEEYGVYAGQYDVKEQDEQEVQEVSETETAERQKEVITMKATNYTNKELVEVYKNLKTSAKILGFSSASDSEMIAEIEIEAIKRQLNLVDRTVEETAEIETAKPETVVQETMEAVEGIMTDKEAYEIIGNRAKELIQNVEVQQKMVEIAKTKSKDEAEKWLYMTAVATLCCCGKSNC